MDISNLKAKRFVGVSDDALSSGMPDNVAPLPDEYLELLLLSNGLELESGICIYSLEAYMDQNITYEVYKYAPHYAGIGSDGGGNLILLRLQPEGESGVFIIGMGALGSAPPSLMSDSLEIWISSGCPIEIEDDLDEYPDFIDVYLDNQPMVGLKGMLQIKSELNISTPVSKLRDQFNSPPVKILKSVPCGKYRIKCLKLNKLLGHCLSVRAVDNPDLRFPLQ